MGGGGEVKHTSRPWQRRLKVVGTLQSAATLLPGLLPAALPDTAMLQMGGLLAGQPGASGLAAAGNWLLDWLLDSLDRWPGPAASSPVTPQTPPATARSVCSAPF